MGLTAGPDRLIGHSQIARTERIDFDGRNGSVLYELDSCVVIIDSFDFTCRDPIFDYGLYTSFQNAAMLCDKPVYRFLVDEDVLSCRPWLEHSVDLGGIDFKSTADRHDAPDASALEYFFEQRFCEVYGKDALQYLNREYPVVSLSGYTQFLDYVVEYRDGRKVAVEENGIRYHHPLVIGRERYLHQLHKQNICSLSGIKVFRFSSEDCRFPDLIDDQIRQFFGDRRLFKPTGLIANRRFTLYEHQRLALDDIALRRQSSNGSSLAVLVVLPTATGKSVIVEEDMKRYLDEHPQARVLVIGPSVRVVDDWKNRLAYIFTDGNKRIGTSIACQIVVGTYHLLWSLAGKVEETFFDYLVFDEAHHAVSAVIKQALHYFQPKFLIGLTATPERLDRKRLEEVFGTYRTTLELRDAMDKGIVAQVRAYRVQTNLDLSEVRFNGKDYVNADLERTLRVDSRNRLIVSVLKDYFHKNQKGLVFCVNVAHAKEVAKLLNEAGLTARAVHGKDSGTKASIAEFKEGSLQFLCSCTLLNEGWDMPEVEVLVMARPTISKVLYLQQLGRGLRKTKRKDELFVIDVVDRYGAFAQPWSCHAVFQMPFYAPFGLVTRHYQVGEVIEVGGLSETVRALVPIDICTFENSYEGYLDVEQAARELFIGTMTLQRWVSDGKVKSDVSLPLGKRSLHYFKPETVDSIRTEKELGFHTAETIKEDFFTFLTEKHFTFSFKLVFMLAMLRRADYRGEVSIEEVFQQYRSFYVKRLEASLPVDRPNCRYDKNLLNDHDGLKRSMLQNPFEKYERKRFVYYGKDLGILAFNSALWTRMAEADKVEAITLLDTQLQEYYEPLGGLLHD